MQSGNVAEDVVTTARDGARHVGRKTGSCDDLVANVSTSFQYLYLRWRSRYPVVIADDLLFLSFVRLFVVSSLTHRNLRSLLLCGKKRNQLETLTQCAERSQFTVNGRLLFSLI